MLWVVCRGVKDRVDAVHLAKKLVRVAHVGQEKLVLPVAAEVLLHEKEVAFFVVQPHQLGRLVFGEELADEF